MNVRAGICLAVQGVLPLGIFLYFSKGLFDWQILVFVPCVVMYFMYRIIWKRIHGYTGDCCGALFLIAELSFYIAVAILWGNIVKTATMNGVALEYNFL